MMPAVRVAVERYWLDTKRVAASVLGDEALAAEIMETAIGQAVAYLTDHPPKSQEDVNAALVRFSRQEVRRRQRKSRRFAFIDFSGAHQASDPYLAHSAVDAALDAERLLADAPPRVREAMMLRYGNAESWAEVAARTGTNREAIRMKMQEISRTYPGRIGNSEYSAVNSGRGTSGDREGFRGRASIIS
jgi:DNA-directed RNA polymerase specialized sigma24 family protein